MKKMLVFLGKMGLAACLSLLLAGTITVAQETDPGRRRRARSPTPAICCKEADGMEFRFSYFPSLDRLRLLVLRPPQQFSQWECVLRPAGKGDVLKRYEGKLPMPAAGETLETPPLDDGTYEITLTLVAADGKRRDVKRTFERKHFPWENTSLGRDRVVIPPFTPLVVDRQTVERRLRAAQARTRRHGTVEASLERRPTALDLAHAAGNRVGGQDARRRRRPRRVYREGGRPRAGRARRGPPAPCKAARSSSSITTA